MDEETRNALNAGLQRGSIFGIAFIIVLAALKYASQSGAGYTLTVSTPLIIIGGVLVFLITAAVKAGYDMYHTTPQYRKYPATE